MTILKVLGTPEAGSLLSILQDLSVLEQNEEEDEKYVFCSDIALLSIYNATIEN